MSQIESAVPVGWVGSPSSNDRVTVTVSRAAAHAPLVGQMLLCAHTLNLGDREAIELGLGMVTSVEQFNTFHNNPAFAATLSTTGTLGDMSGDGADSRTVELKLQACYQSDGDGKWRQAGTNLSTAPGTTVQVRKANNEVIDELVADAADNLHYLGHLHGPATRGDKIRAPLSIPDFSGPEGAQHSAFFGASGSGKTQAASLYLAGQMGRYPDQAVIVIDPQGQLNSEMGMVFSLQGWATEMGRPVVTKRISEDLRLSKDAPLFTLLLSKTRFAREITKMGGETVTYLMDEIEKILKRKPDWADVASEELLLHITSTLSADPRAMGRIYADPNRQDVLRDALDDVSTDPTVKADVLRYFAVVHNLFQPTNPAGGPREPIRSVVGSVFNRDRSSAAPFVILDMSSNDPSWLDSALADADQLAVQDAMSILDDDAIKASILTQLLHTLKLSAESAFRNGRTLNTMVVFDEAHRYAPPPSGGGSSGVPDEISDLSRMLGTFARDTRKFGIGWCYLTQAVVRGLNADITAQLSMWFVGYGLTGGDLEKVADQLDDRDQLRQYKAFAPPRATNPRVYPFLLLGPVSPLSFTKAPLAIAMYTDFDEFRADNADWIAARRAAMGAPPLTGAPVKPGNVAVDAAARVAKAARNRSNPARVAADSEKIRAHAATGGVNPAAGDLLTSDPTFSAGLSAIDDDPPF